MLLDWENSIEQAVKPLFRCSTKKDQQLSHSVQLAVAGADLLWEKSTADWLVASGWCWFGVREKHCWLVGWQASRVPWDKFDVTSYYLYRPFYNPHSFNSLMMVCNLSLKEFTCLASSEKTNVAVKQKPLEYIFWYRLVGFQYVLINFVSEILI